ncbi:Rna rnp complex-1-interacting phosphatase [Fasciola gigantica]|uniref:Rna rnp complex-1-interacting phosphatase n=1 Tax=Fasciola gigantica TaxID=46835 RepID=A0A504YM64_FASGI|nr:Rna rnp complex-1-interacting phosphatase [Fasciola gigantica]
MPRYPPDRWYDYSPFGVPVRGTRLLPIKLPIPKEKSGNIMPNMRFTLDDLIDHIRLYNKKLACVIDLTYTRYYDPKLITARGIRYHKIFVEGHEVPHIRHVKEFNQVVNEVREQDPDGIIAVHCTHGVNRTGYLICRYIVEEMGREPDEVLREFQFARGHPVERVSYIDALMNLSSSRRKSFC